MASGSSSVHEGYVLVPGGRVWYCVIGSSGAIPLLALHGGPGFPHDYLEPLAALADERPVVFYDQLGGGDSDRPDDLSLWRVERFVEELAWVRRELGLDRVHILGHSWGSMLATDYALAQPSGLVSLVLASPPLSIPRWVADTMRLRRELPAAVQATLDRHEAAGTTDREEYQRAVTEYYQRYLCRLNPWPEPMERSMAKVGWPVYNTMWGPSESCVTGNLQDYDRSGRLHEIRVPTLFTCGRYDEATPETTAWYSTLLPGSQAVVFEHSAHMTMLEEPERYAAVVRDFLHRAERAQA